jgi:hypothetical protein
MKRESDAARTHQKFSVLEMDTMLSEEVVVRGWDEGAETATVERSEVRTSRLSILYANKCGDERE